MRRVEGVEVVIMAIIMALITVMKIRFKKKKLY